MYGGFAGNEVTRESRDFDMNPVILSGDFGIQNNNTDNAFHVVVPSQGSVIDGFTITGGNASENFSNDDRGKGAGLWADSATFTVSNCKFISNNSYQGGLPCISRRGIVLFQIVSLLPTQQPRLEVELRFTLRIQMLLLLVVLFLTIMPSTMAVRSRVRIRRSI